jgi:hypothetical protein
MKILGTPILPENFNWSPNNLLHMINEIDKICPEEGILFATITGPTTDDNVNNNVAE